MTSGRENWKQSEWGCGAEYALNLSKEHIR
jgi:hypothetical protein